MFLRTNHIFFGDVIVSWMTAGLGFKMAASNSKRWVCDVIVTSRHVTIDTSKAQSVKLMTCYKRIKFHRKSFNTFRVLKGGGGALCPTPRLRNSKKPRQNGLNKRAVNRSKLSTRLAHNFDPTAIAKEQVYRGKFVALSRRSRRIVIISFSPEKEMAFGLTQAVSHLEQRSAAAVKYVSRFIVSCLEIFI